MKIKRIIYTTLLIIWMIVIFMFSNQNASSSQSTSDKVASTMIDTVTTVTKQEVSKEKKNGLIENTRVFVRKSAHFSLYFVLGILTYLALTSYFVPKTILFSILFCLLYAISDEIHQTLSDGRTPKVMDILIDTIGGSISVGLCYFIEKFWKSRVINKIAK